MFQALCVTTDDKVWQTDQGLTNPVPAMHVANKPWHSWRAATSTQHQHTAPFTCYSYTGGSSQGCMKHQTLQYQPWQHQNLIAQKGKMVFGDTDKDLCWLLVPPAEQNMVNSISSLSKTGRHWEFWLMFILLTLGHFSCANPVDLYTTTPT